MIKIRRGIDIPLAGAADSNIDSSLNVRNVALVGADYEGMKPTMAVSEGDTVRKGQIIFSDKKTLGINFTAPASGKVVALNRGARRVFQSLVIEIDDSLEPVDFGA
ncbi:MAG: NADH:ubiquinone reductase (Na(+)-transporting) subunit A, partial [Halieaceae bacterium]|nr:NADH:ubiquinone reductase (Na(+)-transporting) subunit A [Halieaceae bacterium]